MVRRQQRNQDFLKISKQLFSAGPEDPKNLTADQASAVEKQLRDLVTQTVEAELTSSSADAKGLAAELRALQGKAAPSAVVSNTPIADLFKINGTRNAAIAYIVPEGDAGIPITHPYLEFYSFNGNEWVKQAEAPTETDFQGCTYFVSQVDISGADKGKKLFLVSGFRIGDPGTRLRVRLYTYDGYSVEAVWNRDDLVDGKISLNKDVITVDYNLKYKSSNPLDTVRAEFKIDHGLVKCISQHCGDATDQPQ